MDTHPDRRPGEPDAADQFRRVHAAFEAIMPGQIGERTGQSIEILFTGDGTGSTVSHLIATPESVFVGSTNGELFVLNSDGAIERIHTLGETWVRPVIDADGALIAAWCDGTIFYLEDGELRNLAESEEIPQGIGAFGDGLYLSHGNRLDVVDRTGRIVWSAEFSKSISGVAADGDRLLCAAGVLAAFRGAADQTSPPTPESERA